MSNFYDIWENDKKKKKMRMSDITSEVPYKRAGEPVNETSSHYNNKNKWVIYIGHKHTHEEACSQCLSQEIWTEY